MKTYENFNYVSHVLITKAAICSFTEFGNGKNWHEAQIEVERWLEKSFLVICSAYSSQLFFDFTLITRVVVFNQNIYVWSAKLPFSKKKLGTQKKSITLERFDALQTWQSTGKIQQREFSKSIIIRLIIFYRGFVRAENCNSVLSYDNL